MTEVTTKAMAAKAMNEVIIEAVDVEFAYPDGTQALRKATMEIRKGEKAAILGSNGAGKSTLFLHFNGILRPKSGKIKYLGEELSYKRPALTDLRSRVGIVFQDPDSQLFSASVYQEVSFGPMNLGFSKKEVAQKVEKALRETEIAELENKPTHMLSFGQKKRVSIADILAMEPEVIIFDEPTAWLDPRHAAEFMDILDKLSREGKTIIVSTHDVDLAYSWADKVFIMKEGQVIASGLPTEVFLQEELIYSSDLALPWLVELHKEFVKKGWIAQQNPLPQTKEELFQSIPPLNGSLKKTL